MHRKGQKMNLSGRNGDPYGRAGDRCRIREPGDSRIIRESWHVCEWRDGFKMNGPSIGLIGTFKICGAQY